MRAVAFHDSIRRRVYARVRDLTIAKSIPHYVSRRTTSRNASRSVTPNELVAAFALGRSGDSERQRPLFDSKRLFAPTNSTGGRGDSHVRLVLHSKTDGRELRLARLVGALATGSGC
jgi:hypothetical protein